VAKTVFSNAQLRHVYAAQTQDFGRNSKDSARFRGPVLYSYATPVALILADMTGESVALVSSVTYSNTTAKHIPSARDLAPRPVFRVPYLPGQSGGRYAPPHLEGYADNAAACHAGNLAHLVEQAREYIAKQAKAARRHGATWEDINTEWRDSYCEELKATARDYARRFGLAVPGADVLPDDNGRAWHAEALAAYQAREADPRVQRKREAGRHQRAARAAWVKTVAGPILAEAGLDPRRRYCRAEIAAALKGIPSTDAGASALRARLADRITRHAADLDRWNQAEAERKAREAAEREAETARAAVYGFAFAEWREMFGAVWEGEAENRERDARLGAAHWREVWRAGGSPDVPTWQVPWDRCERGGDMLRVKPGAPDLLETARGAEVHTADALRVWRHVLAVMCAGEEWRGAMRVGHFNINRIDSEWMVAGCHRFYRAEMERVAATLGAPVTCSEIVEGESVA
jgi:hypothetical protein